ncbi:573_t:CDS:2 [Ambispora gerdemannii]|uniref:573_t:CDS:1 n=1 Tax=Ambispora gerdemannii TaxID=144530 RepID=A0A9N8ZKC9_9GLOM|nr:573_t:CDS:2 [Ambispora gerdemannii]
MTSLHAIQLVAFILFLVSIFLITTYYFSQRNLWSSKVSSSDDQLPQYRPKSSDENSTKRWSTPTLINGMYPTNNKSGDSTNYIKNNNSSNSERIKCNDQSQFFELQKDVVPSVARFAGKRYRMLAHHDKILWNLECKHGRELSRGLKGASQG